MLAIHLGVSQQNIAQFRARGMTDTVSIRVAEITGIHAGEIINVARSEREKDPIVKERLIDFVKKVVAPITLPAVVGAKQISQGEIWRKRSFSPISRASSLIA
jgi:hypothetical protein